MVKNNKQSDFHRSSDIRPGDHTILLVEDSLAQATVYSEYLRSAGFHSEHAASGEEALERMAESEPDIVILDMFLPGLKGTDVLRKMRDCGITIPVILITDNASVSLAVEAIKEGAYDFVTKPFGAERICITIEHALREQNLAKIVENYSDNYDRDGYHNFVGNSVQMQSVYRIIDSAAVSKATVFITGESGTGKELCAQAIHAESPRADQPFVAINCAAIPETLMESEIFGHEKGSFTGAEEQRVGAALQASGGTLFFDEICEMSLDLQAKLLRFVQTGAFKSVGGSEEIHVDVRFICATNRDPLEEVQERRFREDLYYRLHVVPIVLPALRHRAGDTTQLATSLLQKISAEEGKNFKTFSKDAIQLLCAYDWPGNVRQLQNILRSIVVLHDGETITRDLIPPPVSAEPVAGDLQPEETHTTDSIQGAPVESLAEMERAMIERAVQSCDGNIAKAAAQLGVSASTLYRKRQITAND